MADFDTPGLPGSWPESSTSSSYNQRVEQLRSEEYPSLKGQIYLDHAGTPPIPKSLIERSSAELISNLYGNPHAHSESSQLSTRMIEDTRLKAIEWLGADPQEYDLVFVANASAAIKLVGDVFRAQEGGFWYGYHKDAHTSLVGLREETTAGHICFETDEVLRNTLDLASAQDDVTELFAFPAQSNMTGRRLPIDWCGRVRESSKRSCRKMYSLVDAAALLSTTPLDLSNRSKNPDMISVSFYKIFGYPDLGGLLVRHEMRPLFERRAFFGGGTVDMALALKEQWHIRKSSTIHDGAEDGTPASHSITALSHAIDVYGELFGSHEQVSRHTSYLTRLLYEGLSHLKHENEEPICVIYRDEQSDFYSSITQGPVIAFNFRRSNGDWYSTTEVEKLANVQNIHLRSGGLCNPGGLASALGLEPWEMQRNFSAGFRCGAENDSMDGKPTASLRISIGAASIEADVNAFLDFCKEHFVERKSSEQLNSPMLGDGLLSRHPTDLFIESLAVYPIKSCAAFRIPDSVGWNVGPEGLAWDRQWCLVHTGTGHALSQKRHPRMALLRPTVDLTSGQLAISFDGSIDKRFPSHIRVPLSEDPTQFTTGQQSFKVCGEAFPPKVYRDVKFHEFFSAALGVKCQLVRMSNNNFKRYTRLQNTQGSAAAASALSLANESPILVVTRSSLNRLNEDIKSTGGKAVRSDVFRPNVVIAEGYQTPPGLELPYAEDSWSRLMIKGHSFRLMGGCRRCQMINIDQSTASKCAEPFLTLSKTRRRDGKVWFGQHCCLAAADVQRSGSTENMRAQITVGDRVCALVREL